MTPSIEEFDMEVFEEMPNMEMVFFEEEVSEPVMVTEEIFTEEFVKITTKNEVIYGIGLESNQNFSKYSIRNIKGTITINQSNE